MKVLGILALAAMAAPAVALAQVSYSEATLARPAAVPILRPSPCLEGQDMVFQRSNDLARDKEDLDAESLAIARQNRRLADELRALDNRDAAAVAAYNARSEAQNRRVEDHNRRVASMNAEAAALNDESAVLMADCRTLPLR